MEKFNLGVWGSLGIFQGLKAFVEEWEADRGLRRISVIHGWRWMDQWLVQGGITTWVITWMDSRMGVRLGRRLDGDAGGRMAAGGLKTSYT